MITNKDIRVENGNLVLNGDKYPLDGQSPEAIMAIVEDNSDTTPTENSNNPVKSGGIFSTIANKVKFLPVVDRNYTCSSDNFENTGVNISCPAGHTYIVRVQISYSGSRPTGLLASSSDSIMYSYMTYAHATDSSFITFMLTEGQTAYIWGRWEASGQNAVRYWIVDITN